MYFNYTMNWEIALIFELTERRKQDMEMNARL